MSGQERTTELPWNDIDKWEIIVDPSISLQFGYHPIYCVPPYTIICAPSQEKRLRHAVRVAKGIELPLPEFLLEGKSL